MDEENQINRIEEYLSGRMTDHDKVLLEKELATDPGFNRLFREHKYFMDGIAGMKAEVFIEKMRGQHEDEQSSPGSKARRNLSYISIAATVALLIGITYFIARPSATDRILKEYYSAPFAQIQRSEPSQEDSLYLVGMRAYGQKDWDLAISILSAIPTSHPYYDRSLYYKGHAFASKGEYEKALGIFSDPVLQNSQYAQQAEWNGILMKVALKYPREEILRELKEIENNPQHFYQSKASKLSFEILE